MKTVNNKVRIFVVDHRERPEKSFLPIIGVGKNRTGDYRDDVGDNIAEWNPWINEATAIYWIWKHLDEVAPQAELVGICHYRRYWVWEWLWWLDCHPSAKRLLPFWDKLARLWQRPSTIGLRPRQLFRKKKSRECDGFIVAWREIWGNNGERGTLRNVFHQSFMCKTPQLFDECLQLMKRHFQGLETEIDSYANGEYAYAFNRSLVSKDEFCRYCEFMFPLILPFAKRIRESNIGAMPVLRRGAGYLFEHMSGLYWHCRMLQGLKLEPLHSRVFTDDIYKPAV